MPGPLPIPNELELGALHCSLHRSNESRTIHALATPENSLVVKLHGTAAFRWRVHGRNASLRWRAVLANTSP
jgi:hypothetical protein